MSSYFAVKKQSTLQEISAEMSKLLNNLDDLNVYLKDSVSLGEQFKNISSLWNTFYNFEEQVKKLQEAGLTENKPEINKETKQIKATNDDGNGKNEDHNQNQNEDAKNELQSTEKQGLSVGNEGK